MLTDLADLTKPTQRADVCIVGAGPAGITLALDLAQRRPDLLIVLAEAGGLQSASARERELYRVELGARQYNIQASRRRTLGGTSAHWGGWCKPYDPIDFEPRNDWPLPGWPWPREALQPYVEQAHRWCDIDSHDYDVAALQQRHPDKRLQIEGSTLLTTQLFRFSPPTRFGTRYQAELEQQGNLHCLLHANLIELQRRGDRIDAARFRCLDGPTLTVSATHFVLAMGGIESARHLLLLRGDAKADGSGIHSPHLGGFFADHVGSMPGLLHADAALAFRRFLDASGPVMPVLVPTRQAIDGFAVRNSCLLLEPRPDKASALMRHAGQRALGYRQREHWPFQVTIINEPRPHADSRLTLSQQRCELGLPVPHLNWHIDEDDFHSSDRLFRLVSHEFGRLGLGRGQHTRIEGLDPNIEKGGASHHMGTARMAADERDGVVDRDCRVFGSDNLYVAGSAVFPRYGYANPTLTIVALSLRLSEHIAALARVRPS